MGSTSGYRPDGKRDRRKVYGTTQKEVVDKLAEIKAKRNNGTLTTPSKQTMKEYLRDWLQTHKRFGGWDGKGLRPNTVRAYENVIEKHILPEIGMVKLQKITPDHLERLYTAILDKGLSMRMPELAHRVLHAALEAAVAKGCIARNPCDRVPRKPRTNNRAEDRPRLDHAQAADVLAAVKGTRFYLPFLVAMTTGMRRGEIIGLRWQNVDLQEGVIHVREQIQLDENKRHSLQPLKTAESIRDVPIPSDVVEELRRHRAAQKVVSIDGDGFVFTNSEGNHFQLGDLSRKFAEVRDQLGLPKEMHFHDLRGSFITWAAQKGLDLKTVMTIVGHADERTTLRIYQSVTEGMKKQAARAFEGFARTAEE